MGLPLHLNARPAVPPLPWLSLVIMALFWATLYYNPVAQAVNGNVGRLCIFGLWLGSLGMADSRSIQLGLKRVFAYRAELILLAGWIGVHTMHLVFRTGDEAYGQFVNAAAPVVAYLGAAFHIRNDPVQYRRAATSILLVLGIISVLLVPIVYREPFVARNLADEYTTTGTHRLLGSWGLFACYGIIVPCLVASALQGRGKHLVWQLALCCSIVVLIMLGTFAAAFLLLAIGVGGTAALFVQRTKRFGIKVVLIAAMLVASGFAYVKFSQFEQFGATIEKIVGITVGIASEGVVRGEPTTRGYLASVSWNTFLENPVFGVGPLAVEQENYRLIGRHAGLVDGLAQYGILGFGWYLAFMVVSFRRVARSLRVSAPSLLDQARVATCAAFLAAGMINPSTFDASFLTLFYVLVLAKD